MMGDENQYFSPDDSISLSLEYYQHHLDHSQDKLEKITASTNLTDKTDKNVKEVETSVNIKLDSESGAKEQDAVANSDDVKDVVEQVKDDSDKCASVEIDGGVKDAGPLRDRRYLQCPAAVSMSHLQKFVRMKYALSGEHKVRFIYLCLLVINYPITLEGLIISITT